MFRAGRLSRLPGWGGRDAELPRDKLPLLISFSHGDLDTNNRTESRETVQKDRTELLGVVIRKGPGGRAEGHEAASQAAGQSQVEWAK